MLKKIGSRVRGLRAEMGLTQQELASKVGVSYSGYQHIEYGTKDPGITKIVALADYFGVSIDYLVGRTDIRKVST